MMSGSAGKSLSSYFLADRNLPWWWLGTSMVATTFAADTPLAITGIVAKDGISGNWFWWSWCMGYMAIAVFFAKKWRGARVITDVELVEIRYHGKAAVALRGVKAFFLSLVVNTVILGWVFRAMAKITQPFLNWREIWGNDAFSILEQFWPSFLIFDSVNNTITVLFLFLVVIIYSSFGGIQGVILTDLVQFAIGIFGAVIFAYYAIDYAGGLPFLLDSLQLTYPDSSEAILNFWPDVAGADASLPIQILLIYVGVQWWTNYYSDGSGYYAQRIYTARTVEDAEKGTIWFVFANFILRTWPWILVALVALIAFPKGDPTHFHPELGKIVGADREMGYPVLMKLILPPGILGIVFVSLMAAFMSTVDTHINWGASYLVNDLYKRFWRPNAHDLELVFASRIAVVVISIFAIFVAAQIQSIEGAWKFLISIASGIGLPQILRWIWWRANAYTEIAGLVSAFVLTILFYSFVEDVRAEYFLLWVAGGSLSISLLVTFLTPPVSETRLKFFVGYIKPFGFWGRYVNYDAKAIFLQKIFTWLAGCVFVFAGMFSVGYLLMLDYLSCAISLCLCVMAFALFLRLLKSDP